MKLIGAMEGDLALLEGDDLLALLDAYLSFIDVYKLPEIVPLALEDEAAIKFVIMDRDDL